MNETSEKMSFAGWSFKQSFKGNWSTIKQLLKVGLPLVVSVQLFSPLWAEFIGTILGKFLIDAGEFYFKQVTLK